MLEAVHQLAQQLGVRRVVLSSLSHVVGYYSRFFGYELTTRHGRSLDFLSQHYVRTKPGDRYAGLDVYHSKQLKEVDLIDPKLCRNGPGPVMVGPIQVENPPVLTTPTRSSWNTG